MSYLNVNSGALTWNYRVYGHGKKLLLAFHGFNRGPDDFRLFANRLGDAYTILAFDLFFHGKSHTEQLTPLPALTLLVIKKLVDQVLESHRADEFEVVAYSFGGRLALNCVEIYGNRVKGIYLMAPDGLRFNPVYHFAVATCAGRFLFRQMTLNPAPLIHFINLVLALKIYKPKAMEFYRNHLLNEQVRFKIYNCWMFHRSTIPDLKRVIAIIRQEKIRLLLFVGKYDNIIPVNTGTKFADRAGMPGSLKILDTGHRLHEKSHEISEMISGNALPD